jgi:hypothetical protein
MRLAEARELSAATAEWQADFRISRGVSAAGVILNIGLVLLATRLVYGDMRRRALQATNLRDQKQELEQQVDERTRELTALSTHLQGVSEQEKSALSRELHDELGGLLVAARMDLSWLQQRLPTSDPSIEQRFKRIHESLSAGVDLKRRVVEELRPTLLDNMGLFAALRWQFKETCRRAGLKCTETIPESEPQIQSRRRHRRVPHCPGSADEHPQARRGEVCGSGDRHRGQTLRAAGLRRRQGHPGEHGCRPPPPMGWHRCAIGSPRSAAAGRCRSPLAGGTVVTAMIPLSKMLAEPLTEPRDVVPAA